MFRGAAVNSKNTYIISIIVVWFIYVMLTLAAPENTEQLSDYAQRWKLSLDQTRTLFKAIIFCMLIPILLIWIWAYLGFYNFNQFATKVVKDDRKAMKNIVIGLQILIFAFIARSLILGIVSAMPGFLRNTPGFVITDNYFTTLTQILSHFFCLRGAYLLYKTNRPSKGNMLPRYLIGGVVLAAVFTLSLFINLSNPIRTLSDSKAYGATYFLPDALILGTVLIPLYIGRMMAMGCVLFLHSLRKSFTTVVYKGYINRLFWGLTIIFISELMINILIGIGSKRLIDAGAEGLIGLVTVLLAIIGLGYYILGKSNKSENLISNYARQLIEASIDPIITISDNGKITDTNKALVSMTGKDFHLLLDLKLEDIIKIPGRMSEILEITEAKGVYSDFGLSIKNASGGFTEVICNATKFYDSHQNPLGIVITAHDVTESKKLHEQLRKAKEEAEKANESKSQFLANMSHELRTPLNAIIGYSDLIKDDYQDKPDYAEIIPDIERINGAGKHLLSLINDILDISKIEANRMDLYIEEINLTHLVKGVVETIEPLVKKNSNKLNYTIPSTLPSVYCDSTKLKQCLYNLLSNAAKFTKEGSITLELKEVKIADKAYIEYIVSDTGIGISESKLGKIFNPFTQAEGDTSKRFGGTGLGLTLTKYIVELFGGKISVQSQEGKGTIFKLQIPTEVKKAVTKYSRIQHTDRSKAVNHIEGNGNGKLVLIIDDDVNTQELIGRMVSKEGYKYKCASNGKEGLSMARELNPNIILLDVLMPGVDGWTVLKELKKDPDLCEIPVVMISISENKELAFELGVEDYFVKPINQEDLIDRLSVFTNHHEGGTLLLIEDDPNDYDVIERSFKKKNWEVVRATNGKEGLERLTDHRPDLILLDLMMPVMDGFQVLEKLKFNPDWHEIPVVIITSKDLSEQDLARINGNLQNLIHKASQPLNTIVNKALRYLNPGDG